MLFRQILHDDLGCASYVIASDGSAAIIDPQWDIEPYLELARVQRLQITEILLTHHHADHVSGHGRLRAATGATIHVSADADAAYEHHGLADADVVQVGRVEIRAFATPGHRPEHLSFLVVDLVRGEEPVALLSGDFIFVGDLARPDLAVEPRDGAATIYDSIQRLADASPHLEIWPGHIGGSLCGGSGMSRKPSSTLGYERAHNELLACADRDEFVDRLTTGLAPQPPNFRRVAELNRGPLITDALTARALTPARVAELVEAGDVVIDVRDAHEHAAEHIPGSLNVPSSASAIGTRAAWLTTLETPIIVLAATEASARTTVTAMQAAGLLHTHGYVEGGIAAWRAAGQQVEASPIIGPAALADRLRASDPPLVVDVRSDAEWSRGHVADSIHAPLYTLRGQVPAALERANGTDVAVVCATGTRSALAASYLRRQGIGDVIHVADGGVPDLTSLDIHLTTGA